MRNTAKTITLLTLLVAITFGAAATLHAQQIVRVEPGASGLGLTPSPEGATVTFRNLSDGDEVSKSFRVRFVIEGMKVRPAGTDDENSGHHHLLIDVDELPPMDLPLPKNESVYHFGKGERSASITMPPGEHTLQLLFADYRHIPHDPPVMSEKITVIVVEDADQ
jgi:hypothetical protein